MDVYGQTTTNNQQQQQPPNARPFMQDPNEQGEVDLNRYPEAQDSTNKVRGKNEFIDSLVGGLEPELINAKGFYFFFYAAFGSLFPLMGVYFKQLGLNGAQAGLLTGIRPLIEYLSAPFWLDFAEKQRKTKQLLLISLACWVLFTFPLGSIQPEPRACLEKFNDSTMVLKKPDAITTTFTSGNENKDKDARKKKREIVQNGNGELDFSLPKPEEVLSENHHPKVHLYYNEEVEFQNALFHTSQGQGEGQIQVQGDGRSSRRKRAIPKIVAGISPLKISYASNYDPNDDKDSVSPSFSSLVFKKDDINKVFMLLLLLIVFGECLSSPAIVVVDGAVLSFLGDEAGTRYGHQRMFGSIGWAISMFFVGIALDHSTFHQRKCDPLPQEKNYTVCFAIFVVLMGLAMLLAWRIKVVENNAFFNTSMNETANNMGGGYEMNQTNPDGSGGFNEFENVDINSTNNYNMGKPNAASSTVTTTVFASQNKRKLPNEILNILKHFKSPNCIAFLVVAWVMGIGIGLIFTFLFWHLQDFGGSPTLFGIASVINHISEVFAYFFATTFIQQLGHVKVLCIGLGCNILRFLYISILSNPWWILPFEFVQGITHAAVWAACSSFLNHNTPPELRPQAQTLLQGLHHGLGRGFGAIVGGLFVASKGSIFTFRLYAFICLITLGVFAFLNFYRKDAGGFISEIPFEQDPHTVMSEETSHLAPHGVPGGLPRVHSNTKLDQQNYPSGPAGQDLFNQSQNQSYSTNPQQQQQQPPVEQQPGVGNNPFNQQYYMR